MNMELLTMMGGAGTGFIFQMLANAQKDRQEQFAMITKSHKMAEDSAKAARAYNAPGANIIRRFIVVISYALAAFLVIAGLFVPTNLIVEAAGGNFLGLFTWGGDTKIITVSGLVAYPWLITSILAIVSFYFGQKPAKR